MSRTDVTIHSERMNETYKIIRFSEYEIDIDLEVDADQFNMVFENPNGEYTGIFNKFDKVNIAINDTNVLKGTIDETEYNWDTTESVIRVVGRDIISPLVDNDAIPTTRYNVRPHAYISDKCREYGIPKFVVDSSVPAVDKLIIGTSETEISIMNNMLYEHFKHIWTIYDTLYMGDWNMNAQPSYLFTRGVPDNGTGIPIQKLRLRDSGLDMRSEIRIYGSMNDGTEKVVGTARNDYLVNKGIKKRRVLRSYNNDSSSKYASNAIKNVRNSFRDGIELVITIKTDDQIILPNRTARVIDSVTKVNSVFFIRGVTFKKSVNGGSLTTVTMVPGDATFNIIWQNQGSKSTGNITGLSSMSIDELLRTRK